MSDPFTLLEVPARFDLDAALLHANFLRLVGTAHPDRFPDPLEQADAVRKSARVNDAYRTLGDPESRARALLALRGDVSDTAAGDALPPALLMEVMAAREALDDAVAASDYSELARLRKWAEDQRTSQLRKIAELFAASTLDGTAVRRELNALRYMQRMLEQMPGV